MFAAAARHALGAASTLPVAAVAQNLQLDSEEGAGGAMGWAANPVVNGLLADAALLAGHAGTRETMATTPSLLKDMLSAFNTRFHWTAVCPRCRRACDFRHQTLGGRLSRACPWCPWHPPLRDLMTWWMETPRGRQRVVLEMLMAMEMDDAVRDEADMSHWRGRATTRRRWSSAVA